MRYTQLLSETLPWLALALMSAAPAWGQDVAQPSSAGEESPPEAGVLQEPAGLSDSPLQPVTVEHRGRLLVLTYGPKPRADGSVSFTHPRGKPPRFAVYQGQRQIASGQFEYG